MTDSLTATEKECICCYGFIANPSKPIWENIPSALKAIQATTYLNSPYNLHCHNLCKTLPLPTGYNQLLDLSLNYCIERKKPTPNIQNTLDKLNRSDRLKAWLKDNPIKKDKNYNPNLYLPSCWKPPEAPSIIEQSLKTFGEKLKEITEQNTARATPNSNLTRLQKNCLQKMLNDKCYIVCLSDKNLGSVLMERIRILNATYQTTYYVTLCTLNSQNKKLLNKYNILGKLCYSYALINVF